MSITLFLLVRKAGEDIITLSIENERINITPGQPFMTDKGWIEAKNLSVVSSVLTKDNLYKIIENMEIRSYNYVKTYNLTVENNHNFFITELGIVVHNMDCKNVKLG